MHINWGFISRRACSVVDPRGVISGVCTRGGFISGGLQFGVFLRGLISRGLSPAFGADTVLKLGARAGNFLACPQICVVPPNSGDSGGMPQWKIDIVKITVKNKALLTWRLADIHNTSQNTPPEI